MHLARSVNDIKKAPYIAVGLASLYLHWPSSFGAQGNVAIAGAICTRCESDTRRHSSNPESFLLYRQILCR